MYIIICNEIVHTFYHPVPQFDKIILYYKFILFYSPHYPQHISSCFIEINAQGKKSQCNQFVHFFNLFFWVHPV